MWLDVYTIKNKTLSKMMRVGRVLFMTTALLALSSMLFLCEHFMVAGIAGRFAASSKGLLTPA